MLNLREGTSGKNPLPNYVPDLEQIARIADGIGARTGFDPNLRTVRMQAARSAWEQSLTPVARALYHAHGFRFESAARALKDADAPGSMIAECLRLGMFDRSSSTLAPSYRELASEVSEYARGFGVEEVPEFDVQGWREIERKEAS